MSRNDVPYGCTSTGWLPHRVAEKPNSRCAKYSDRCPQTCAACPTEAPTEEPTDAPTEEPTDSCAVPAASSEAADGMNWGNGVAIGGGGNVAAYGESLLRAATATGTGVAVGRESYRKRDAATPRVLSED